MAPGPDPDTFSMGAQLWIQVKSVLFTIVWSGRGVLRGPTRSPTCWSACVSEEAERQGLDISYHGETAYNR